MKTMDIENRFLPHLSDPLRRTIAAQFAKQEFRKLLPNLRDASVWQSTDKQIDAWYDALSLRNFWNGIHGLTMGFRLKSVVPWITSLHMQWDTRTVPVEELWFSEKFGPIQKFTASCHALDVQHALSKPENAPLANELQKTLDEQSRRTTPRDDFSIFVIRKHEKLRVIDGNRRLLDAIVREKNEIFAAVGEPVQEPALFEHWVPTSLLVDLVFWHKHHKEIGRDTTESTAATIAELIRDSSAGRIEFRERAVHPNDDIHRRLLDAVEKKLAEANPPPKQLSIG